jgi:hypothetical protein
MMDSWIDKFKDYVPAEILAAFITINSLVPYKQGIDVVLLVSAVLILTAIFVISSLRSANRQPWWIVTLVAITLPLWCLLIAIQRVDEYYPSDDIKIAISVILVLFSVGLTTFASNKDTDLPTT